jgi:diguanylate cyclase (GGDEF)-like protein
MRFLPKKIDSRRQVFWLTVQIAAYALISAIIVTTLIMKITGKFIPDIYLFTFIVPLVVAPPIAYWLANLIYEITRLGEEIERIAYADDLTGIANRRAFFEKAPDLIAQSTESEDSISVILIDIDHFKKINDTYGHKAGDAMLILVADILTQSMRDTIGIVGRIGGEEFALVIVHKNSSYVVALADQIRLNIKNASINIRNTLISTTASIGLARHVSGTDLDHTLLCADKALYLAKNTGRDRIVLLNADG